MVSTIRLAAWCVILHVLMLSGQELRAQPAIYVYADNSFSIEIFNGDSASFAKQTNFGILTEGGPDSVHYFTIVNWGDENLHITNATVTPGMHFLIDGWEQTLLPGMSTLIAVNFQTHLAPIGIYNATITIASNAPGANPFTFGVRAEVRGAPGEALHFDGINDRILATLASAPQGAGARTIECWVKTSASTISQTLVNYGPVVNNQRFALLVASGKLYVSAHNNDFNTNVSVNDGVWHHVAATYDGTTVRVYKDGLLVGSQAKTYATTGTNVEIGSNWRGSFYGEFLNGTLDEVRIWNVARTQEEIQMNMLVELSSGSGLLAAYNFNQGNVGSNNSGVTTLLDVLGTSNGTLYNFALTGPTSNWVGSGFPLSKIWTGAVSNSWYNAANWSGGVVPDSTDNVTLPSTSVTNEVAIISPITLASLSMGTGRTVTLNAGGNLTINGGLFMNGGNITLNNQNLTFGASAVVSNAAATRAIVTNGTGSVSRSIAANGSFQFPIAPNATSYNPVTVTLGAGDPTETFSASVKSTFDNPPIDPDAALTRQWTVNEGTPGGNNATLAFQYSSSDPAGISFQPAGSTKFIGRHTGSEWALTSGTHSGSDPYTVAASGFTAFSPFIISETNTAPPPPPPPPQGEALHFDGVDDYVAAPFVATPQGNSARTIECWVRTTAGTALQTLVSYGPAVDNQRFGLMLASGNIVVSGYNNDFNTGVSVNDGVWHHIAATYDGTTVRVYKDGALVGTQAKAFASTGTTLEIGANWGGSSYGEFLNGTLDEVRIWDVARTLSDIRTFMFRETESGLGLRAAFSFNHGVTTGNNGGVITLLDAVGGSNGTLTNFALTGSTSNWVSGVPSLWTSIPGVAPYALNGVWFADAIRGTVVGNEGTIRRTTNGGRTWVNQVSGTTNALWGITFADANTGIAVGEGGTIRRTSDAGDTWTSQPSGTTTTLWGVAFNTSTLGLAVGSGGRVLQTYDGGVTWTTQTIGSTDLHGVSYKSFTPVVVGGAGTIMQSTNGGVTWESRASGTSQTLWGISFGSDFSGTAVGDGGTILRTADGGMTWTPQSSGTSSDLYGVHFTDAFTGTVVGRTGTILRTTNGGTTWINQHGITWEDLSAAFFTTATSGFVVGTNYNGNNVLRAPGLPLNMWSGAAGTDWSNPLNWFAGVVPLATENVTLPATGVTNEVSITSPVTVRSLFMGTGRSIVLNTGGSLTVNGLLSMNGGNITLNDQSLIFGPWVGVMGAGPSRAIVTNGAGTVSKQFLDFSPFRFPIAATPNSFNPVTIQLTAGPNQAETFSVSVKSTFDNPPNDPTLVLNRQWTINEATPGGNNVTLAFQYSSSDPMGASFQPAAPEKFIGRYTGSQWNSTSATLSGSDPYVVTAGGFTEFSPFAISGTAAALPVQLASFTGVFVNNSVRLHWRTISEINNYGFYVQRKLQTDSLWTELPNSFVAGHGTTNEPHEYAFVDESAPRSNLEYRLRQVDLDGTVHYTDPISVSGVTSVGEKEIPKEYSLSQNYPNPFNPSTTIAFGLPKDSYVRLEVYNALGQRVAELVNGTREAGYYAERFDATTLASGLYIYRLQAGEFVQVRKLMVLK